jgi:surface protein
MRFMFAGASGFNADISGWNTAAVTDMSGMFEGALAFNADISGWNTAAVTGMHKMFYGASAFNADISGWNTAAVTGMSYMFYGAPTFNADISGWNMAAVTDMSYMFDGASAFSACHAPAVCLPLGSVCSLSAPSTPCANADMRFTYESMLTWVRAITTLLVVAISIFFAKRWDHCSADGCNARRPKGRSFCQAHGCSADGCKAMTSEGCAFCGEHGCSADGCNAVSLEGCAFCGEHGCSADGCNAVSLERRAFCEQHGCSAGGCNEKRPEGRTFCAQHGCAADGCKGMALKSRRFCQEHGCSASGCDVRKAGTSSIFCLDHECALHDCKGQRASGSGSTFCSKHKCSVGDCKEHTDGTSGQCSEHERLASLSTTRKDITNSRYGTGDAADLKEDVSKINVTGVQWFVAPLSGSGKITKIGNQLCGWKHSVLILQCEWANAKGMAPFDLFLEMCEVSGQLGTVGAHGCLLLSKGGAGKLGDFGGEPNSNCPDEMRLAGHAPVTLGAVIDTADKLGAYSLENCNCHDMAFAVCNFVLGKKNMPPLEKSCIPNRKFIKAAKVAGWFTRILPGSKAEVGCGAAKSQSGYEYDEMYVQVGKKDRVTKEFKAKHTRNIAVGVGVSVSVGAAVAVAACPPVVLAAVAGGLTVAKGAAEQVGVKIGTKGHATMQHDPCESCKRGTVTKHCGDCKKRLCQECANFPEHRGHRLTNVKKNSGCDGNAGDPAVWKAKQAQSQVADVAVRGVPPPIPPKGGGDGGVGGVGGVGRVGGSCSDSSGGADPSKVRNLSAFAL